MAKFSPSKLKIKGLTNKNNNLLQRHDLDYICKDQI